MHEESIYAISIQHMNICASILINRCECIDQISSMFNLPELCLSKTDTFKNLYPPLNTQTQQESTDSAMSCKAGHLLLPIAHSSYTSSKVNILCEGNGIDGHAIAKETLNIVKDSIKVLAKSLNLPFAFEHHRRKLHHLLESCSQELNQSHYKGGCSLLCSYFVQNHLVVMKNANIMCYLINKNQSLKPISSQNVPFKIKHKEKHGQFNIETNQSKLLLPLKDSNGLNNLVSKCIEKVYKNIKYNHNYIEPTMIEEIILTETDQFLLFGSEECFSQFTAKQLVDYFYQKEQNLDMIGKTILEEAKKRWKTIYQKDMTLILVRLPQ